MDGVSIAKVPVNIRQHSHFSNINNVVNVALPVLEVCRTLDVVVLHSPIFALNFFFLPAMI